MPMVRDVVQFHFEQISFHDKLLESFLEDEPPDENGSVLYLLSPFSLNQSNHCFYLVADNGRIFSVDGTSSCQVKQFSLL